MAKTYKAITPTEYKELEDVQVEVKETKSIDEIETFSLKEIDERIAKVTEKLAYYQDMRGKMETEVNKVKIPEKE